MFYLATFLLRTFSSFSKPGAGRRSRSGDEAQMCPPPSLLEATTLYTTGDATDGNQFTVPANLGVPRIRREVCPTVGRASCLIALHKLLMSRQSHPN